MSDEQAYTAMLEDGFAKKEAELAALETLLESRRELYHCEHCAKLSGKGIGCMCGPGHRRRVYVIDADAVDGVLKGGG